MTTIHDIPDDIREALKIREDLDGISGELLGYKKAIISLALLLTVCGNQPPSSGASLPAPVPSAPEAPPTNTPAAKTDKLIYAPEGDPELEAASKRARATFKYFWRTYTLDKNRVTPTIETAYIKVPIYGTTADGETRGESPWWQPYFFDGTEVYAVLINQPIYVTEFSVGYRMKIPLANITDWSFDTGEKVYGGFTIHLLRSRMSDEARKQHDERAGMPYGDPEFPLISPLLQGPQASLADSLADPMAGPLPPDIDPNSAAAVPVWRKQLGEQPELMSRTDDTGLNLIQQQCVAGNLDIVQVLVEAGADTQVKRADGLTLIELAQETGWPHIAEWLKRTQTTQPTSP